MGSRQSATGKDLSLVVCTRNRSGQLAPALESLAAIRSWADWELVVVDNGSTDDTRAILERFSPQLEVPLRYVFEAQPGLGRARNAGWRKANGTVIAFTDDDCYPASDFVDQLLLCFEDASIGYLGGRVLLYDPTDLPMTIQLSQVRSQVKPNRFIPSGLIHGANFAFRREVLHAIDGFDDGLGAGTPYPCEDVDALARAVWLGYPGAYDPRPLVFHRHGRKTTQDLQKLLRGYDSGNGAYFMKFLMNSRTRGAYLRAVLSRALSQSPGRTLGELRGALAYRASLQRSGRIERT